MLAAVGCATAQVGCDRHPTSFMESDISAFQDISERIVNPFKLVSLLRRRFGVGTYEIYIIHDVYSIRAPELLSEDDIKSCK